MWWSKPKLIGEGGMGSVVQLPGGIARKSVRVDKVSNFLPASEMFRREVRMNNTVHGLNWEQAGITRPPKLLGYDRAEMTIDFEYVDGVTLEKYLMQEVFNKPLDERIKLTKELLNKLVHGVFSQLILMSYVPLAKDKEGVIIHRDLSPRNILITKESATIFDFGISAAKIHSNNSVKTTELLWGGTPGYFCPAIMFSDQDNINPLFDPRADLFSFGSILFFIMSGGRLPIDYSGQRNSNLSPIQNFAEYYVDFLPEQVYPIGFIPGSVTMYNPLAELVNKFIQVNPVMRLSMASLKSYRDELMILRYDLIKYIQSDYLDQLIVYFSGTPRNRNPYPIIVETAIWIPTHHTIVPSTAIANFFE